MQIPTYPEFKHLELDDVKIVKEYLLRYPKNICEFSLANLFTWRSIGNAQITLINDNLCFLMTPEFEPCFFLEPLGEHKIQETVQQCLDMTEKMAHVSEAFIKVIDKAKFTVTPVPENFDYIYQRQDLADLKGRRFDSKRNHINKFKRMYPNYVCQDFDQSHFSEALKLFDIWHQEKSKKLDQIHPMFGFQRKIIEEALSLFGYINFLGRVIYIDNRFCGFIIGSELNSKMIDVHFFYGHPEIPGVYQLLLNDASKTVFSGYDFLNLEEDLGLKSLQQAKLSYAPQYLEHKYEIRKQT